VAFAAAGFFVSQFILEKRKNLWYNISKADVIHMNDYAIAQFHNHGLTHEQY